jgi:hypothetical protein
MRMHFGIATRAHAAQDVGHHFAAVAELRTSRNGSKAAAKAAKWRKAGAAGSELTFHPGQS